MYRYKKPVADPDLQLGETKLHNGVSGRSPKWGSGAKPLVKGWGGTKSLWSWRHFLISESNFL